MGTRKNFLYLGGEKRISSINTHDHHHHHHHHHSTFEFDESDLWNSSNDTGFVDQQPAKKSSIPVLPNSKWASRKPVRGHDHAKSMAGTSLPVNVPDWSKILRGEYKNGRRSSENDDDMEYSNGNYDDDEDEDDDHRLPPHEYLARTRIASFSVHEGVGRTLKGRDLRRVRNAIWKQTGFED